MNFFKRLSRTFVIGSLSLAGALSFSEPANDSASYEHLCNYDNLCGNLKNRDGSYVLPKPGLLQVMSALKNPVIDISKQLGVDPMAVAGSIVAENSMNVQVDDDTHSFLEKIKLNPLANDISRFIRGKSFSIGFGQIKPETAQAAEGLLAKVEGRAPRTLSETTAALVNPLENIKYAAAIVRGCQDSYKAHGFDVSGNPPVLASLYNLGDCETRARRAEESKKAPRVNYFGFFVNHFQDEIRKGVGLDEKIAGKPASFTGSVKIDRQLKGTVTLLGAPPKCSSDGAGQMGEYNKIETLNYSSRSTSARGPYKVLAPGIDCDMKDWSLLRTDRGEIGWVSNATLDMHSEPYVRVNGGGACDPKIAEKCNNRIKAQLGKDFIGFDENGLMEIRLAGGDKQPDKPDFKAFDLSSCFSSDNPSSGSNPYMKTMTAEEAEGIAKAFEVKKAEIINALKLKEFDDSRNPYRDVGSTIANLKSTCTPKCRGNVDMLRNVLTSKPSDFASYQGYKKFKAQFWGTYLSTVNESAPAKGVSARQANYAAWQDVLRTASSECEPVLNGLPDSREKFAKIKTWVEEQNKDGTLSSPLSASQSPAQLASACRGVKAAQKAHLKNPGAPLSLGESECRDCYFPMTFMSGNSGTTSSTRFSEMAEYATEGQDYDDLLSAAMTDVAGALNRSFGGDSKPCSYNPIATASRIEALSSDSCVESVFAPDYYLVNKFSNRVGGAFYKPFSEDDRFAIKLKDGCGRLESANADSPTGGTGAEK